MIGVASTATFLAPFCKMRSSSLTITFPICQSNDSVEMEKELVQKLNAYRVDAVIAACTLYSTDFSHFDILSENNIPLVFYDRVPVKPYPACIIKGDDFRGGYLGTSHLIELGCRRIAFIAGPITCNLYIDRQAGFEKRCSKTIYRY